MASDDPNRPGSAASAAFSAALAEWAADISDGFGDAAYARARNAFVDVFACMVAGAVDETTRIVGAASSAWSVGPSTVIGSTAGRAPPLAALINGVAAHALDFDDNFDPAKAHITAVLVPAILALAEARGLNGHASLDAYIVGLQIAAKVGQGLNPFHRNRGWHATSTVGAVGAAAACGRLIGLDKHAMRHCLNMSTSYAGGFMSQFGSMTKPLHAGKAAEAGVVCALFAEAGLTAGAETFDGPTGMARLMVGPDLDQLRGGNFKREHGQTMNFDGTNVGVPLAITAYGLKVKRYPTCASTHRALDAILELKAAHGFTAAEVVHVDVHAPLSHFNNLMYTDPQDGMQAKFSMEYCAAVALRNGAVGLADFSPENLRDGATRQVMRTVARHPVDKPESEFPTRVEITLRDGRRCAATVDAPKGRADNPLSDAECDEKLFQCCRGVLATDQAKILKRALDRLDGPEPIGEVMRLLAFEPF